MTGEVAQWRAQVADAGRRGDAALLQTLYADGREFLGDRLGEEWARALSALDGTAITG